MHCYSCPQPKLATQLSPLPLPLPAHSCMYLVAYELLGMYALVRRMDADVSGLTRRDELQGGTTRSDEERRELLTSGKERAHSRNKDALQPSQLEQRALPE
mmetsp:Transcript_34082/g.56436  ORF Transcript_34082/g.56436 Transcript_34082/m.56436 type:complete len:101 (+) Transcript_34082:1030-1332(+)